MKHIFKVFTPLLVTSILSVGASSAPTEASTSRPNIVIILFDDLGYGDLGCQGGTDTATPHIDSLAKRGARFTSAYSNGSFCTPTRAALMGCRYQHRFGVEALQGRDGLNALPTEVTTLPERLREVGYRTAFVGKWHLGEQEGCRPEDQGFEEVLDQRNRARGSADRTLTQATLGAEFIEKHRDDTQPFFLYLAYNAVHVPVAATNEYLNRFQNIEDEKRRTYAAMLSAADDGVGMVLDALKKTGKLANTLIMCTSDNGGPTTRNGTNGSRNTPLHGSKCETFEGGIRVPLLMQLPSVINADTTYDKPVISFDLSATALALAGAEPSQIDGIDLLPYITSSKTGTPHEVLFWRSRTMNNNYAVRQGDWKYVHTTFHELSADGQDKTYVNDPPSTMTAARDMLFNIAADIREQHDVSNDQPAKLAELKKLYEAWCNEVDADCRKLGREPQMSKPANLAQPKRTKPTANEFFDSNQIK